MGGEGGKHKTGETKIIVESDLLPLGLLENKEKKQTVCRVKFFIITLKLQHTIPGIFHSLEILLLQSCWMKGKPTDIFYPDGHFIMTEMTMTFYRHQTVFICHSMR